MPETKPGHEDLRRELAGFRERYTKLADDELFVLWFLRAFVADDDESAIAALCGASRDKGVDAVLIDARARVVFLIQGKYRHQVADKAERRGDVMNFAQLAGPLCSDEEAYAALAEDLSPEVLDRMDQARAKIQRDGYVLTMYYATLGRCSPALEQEAAKVVRKAGDMASLQIFDGKRVLLLLADYLDGVAPPVPSLDLEIEAGSGVRSQGMLNRYDSKTDIESWVFSMTDASLAGLFERAGVRLFARNVRGFLGSTGINKGMEETLASEPEYFWYYNNGVTIVCDEATLESSRGREVLSVTNPQLINGQQTTRTLSRRRGKGPRASVLVRVIRVPREPRRGARSFEALVSQIVEATNWQNSIRASDLMSNDRQQIQIERQLRKLNYQYMRKRATKSEARRGLGRRHMRQIKKEELAQAVAACELDPGIVREGKERLFEKRWYGQVFPTANPDFYLPRYWLMRQVSNAARGRPERAYAKWLVLNFCWSRLEPICRSRVQAAAFREACEQNERTVLGPLNAALNAAFRAALQFYRFGRGSGVTAIDVSTFFKRRALNKEFDRFWGGRKNGSRAAFNKAWARFGTAFAKAMES